MPYVPVSLFELGIPGGSPKFAPYSISTKYLPLSRF